MSVKKTLLYFGFATGIYILQFKSFNFSLFKNKICQIWAFFQTLHIGQNQIFQVTQLQKSPEKGSMTSWTTIFFFWVVDIFDQFTTQNKNSHL
jgi:hypothetical protein